MPDTNPLTVVQLLALTTAAQRPDYMVLPLPPTIRARGGAQRNLLRALLKMELVEEVQVDDATLSWHTDDAGQHRSLRITAAGLAAAGVSSEAPEPMNTSIDDQAPGPSGSDAAAAQEAPAEHPSRELQPRRPTGKLGDVLRAISCDAGATLMEITTLTGWLPHTARAAVTGLRQRGFPIQLIQHNGRKAYRLTAAG